MSLAFKVEGTPAPQGSKSMMRHKTTGKMIMLESSAGVKPWRDQIAAKARFVTGPGWPPLSGPVWVAVTFILKRPKYHYGTGRNAATLKDSAPEFPDSTGGMDVDKLARAVLDALTSAKIWGDDSQVIELRAKKIYAGSVPMGYADHPGAYITVAPLYGQDAA